MYIRMRRFKGSLTEQPSIHVSLCILYTLCSTLTHPYTPTCQEKKIITIEMSDNLMLNTLPTSAIILNVFCTRPLLRFSPHFSIGFSNRNGGKVKRSFGRKLDVVTSSEWNNFIMCFLFLLKINFQIRRLPASVL